MHKLLEEMITCMSNEHVIWKDAGGIICFSHVTGFGLSLAEKMIYAE